MQVDLPCLLFKPPLPHQRTACGWVSYGGRDIVPSLVCSSRLLAPPDNTFYQLYNKLNTLKNFKSFFHFIHGFIVNFVTRAVHRVTFSDLKFTGSVRGQHTVTYRKVLSGVTNLKGEWRGPKHPQIHLTISLTQKQFAIGNIVTTLLSPVLSWGETFVGSQVRILAYLTNTQHT